MKSIAQHRPDAFKVSKIRRERTFTTDWSLPEPARAEVIPFETQSARRERVFAVEWVIAEPMGKRTQLRTANGGGRTCEGVDYYCEWS